MSNRTLTASAIVFSLFSLGVALPAAARHRPAAAPASPVAKDASSAAKEAPLAFTRLGKGPAVVFLHGLGGDRAVWASEIVRLSPKFTVVAVDLPGHGQSPGPKAAPTTPAVAGQPAAPLVDLKKVAQQVARLIHSEHLAPAVVVGHSMGGQVAAWLPLVDREAVRGVLMVDSFLTPPTISDSERTRLRADLKRDLISTLRRFYAPLTNGSGQLDKIVASAQRVPPAVFMGYLDYMMDNELDEKAGEITVPVHLLAGPLLIANNNDQVKAHLSLQQAGLTAIPNLTYDYFPSSKHWLFWDEPERFNDAVDRFLNTVTRPAVSVTKGRPKG
jgi:pimeloyl-ACP methyl ester carboxylesterase